MTVAAILEKKGGAVVTVELSAPVRDVVALLAEHRIGAVVAMDGEKVAGILSERDLVYCIAKAALSDMSKRRIRHLPVVEGGRLVGLVSIGDLVAWRIAKIEEEAQAMRAYIQGA
jgi:CBS domain-containing protein